MCKPNRDRIENLEYYFCGGEYSQNHKYNAKRRYAVTAENPSTFHVSVVVAKRP